MKKLTQKQWAALVLRVEHYDMRHRNNEKTGATQVCVPLQDMEVLLLLAKTALVQKANEEGWSLEP